MDMLGIWGFLLFGLGMFFLGYGAGESNVVRCDRRRGVVRIETSSNFWPALGLVVMLAGLSMGIIAAHPPEAMFERADQIGISPATLEH